MNPRNPTTKIGAAKASRVMEGWIFAPWLASFGRMTFSDDIDEDQTAPDEQTYARQVIPDQEEIDAYGHEDDRRSDHGQQGKIWPLSSPTGRDMETPKRANPIAASSPVIREVNR